MSNTNEIKKATQKLNNLMRELLHATEESDTENTDLELAIYHLRNARKALRNASESVS